MLKQEERDVLEEGFKKFLEDYMRERIEVLTMNHLTGGFCTTASTYTPSTITKEDLLKSIREFQEKYPPPPKTFWDEVSEITRSIHMPIYIEKK